MKKENININNFNELNQIWKGNIVLSRFVFKYSLFAENYLLAILENALLYNKEEFCLCVKNEIENLQKAKKEISLKKLNKLKEVQSNLINENFIFNLKFSEKIILFKTIKITNLLKVFYQKKLISTK